MRVYIWPRQLVNVWMCCKSGAILNHMRIKSETNREGLAGSEISAAHLQEVVSFLSIMANQSFSSSLVCNQDTRQRW